MTGSGRQKLASMKTETTHRMPHKYPEMSERPVKRLKFLGPRSFYGKPSGTSLSSNIDGKSRHTIDWLVDLRLFRIIYHQVNGPALEEHIAMDGLDGVEFFEPGNTYTLPHVAGA